jgi:thiol-disulfide isomerase/thioredoxin
MELHSEAEFDKAIESGRVVVEVYANWCPDCRRIEGHLMPWAERFADRFAIYRVNRDDVPAVADRYEVMGIPSFLVFQDGELQARLLSRDAKSAKQVEDFLALQFP